MRVLKLLVLATEENFNAKAYLGANPDVAASGMNPLKHFRSFGRDEGRRQIDPDSVTQLEAFRKEKFTRFSQLLDLSESPAATTFPVHTGRHLTAADYQAESANADFGPFVAEMSAHPDRNFLDLGCGLRQTVYDNCLYLEIYPSLSADLVVAADGRYPIVDNAFDGIGCFAVLEHTSRPWEIVAEIRRMLKPGGKVWIDWPFLQPVHGYPSHYFNATQEGLRSLFEAEGFRIENISTMPHQGPDYAVTWILRGLFAALPKSSRSRLGQMRLDDILAHPAGDAFWREMLSGLDQQSRATYACGNVLLATKPAASEA